MEGIDSRFIKRAKYQREIDENIAQCLTCEHKCKIQEGHFGACQTRTNIKGVIHTIVYGCIPSLNFNPIEKKPFFHFNPGTVALTIGTFGCNFNCFWCQNHDISHPDKPIVDLVKKSSDYISPEDLIKITTRKNIPGTSISFNEPTLLFEYSLEVFKLARKEGLYNTYVSNGYMTEEVLKDLAENGLDAINIDVKGDAEMVKKYCRIDVEKVWRNAKLAKELGIHVEITTLIIQKLNSCENFIKEIAERIVNELGEFTPFHMTRFFPDYKAPNFGYFMPTPEKILFNAHDIAKAVGLKYVYIGNLERTEYETTECPRCSKIVIKRKIFGVKEMNLDDSGNCKFCGQNICVISKKAR